MKSPTSRFTATPKEFGDLRILGVGIHDSMTPGFVHRPYGLGCYLLAIFHAKATIRLQDVNEQCAPQSLVIFPPEVCHHFGTATSDWEYSWILCDGPFMHTLLKTLKIPYEQALFIRDPSALNHSLQALFHEYSAIHPNPAIVRNHFHSMLIEVQRQITAIRSEQPLPSWVAAIQEFIETPLR